MPRLSVADRAAAEELFTAYNARLTGWVRRLVDDDDTAHEIASEAFTRLLARWHTLDSPQGYLSMIAANLVRDHWRRAGRQRRAISVMTAAARPDRGYQPVQDVEVRALIQALPASMRSAFLLHYYAGFALREVAVMLGRTEGTVKSDLSQARARLRAAVAPSLPDPSDPIRSASSRVNKCGGARVPRPGSDGRSKKISNVARTASAWTSPRSVECRRPCALWPGELEQVSLGQAGADQEA